jgi:hypothetical protein
MKKPALLAALLLSSISCGELTRQGTASSYLSVESLEASSGAKPTEFSGDLASDVITVVNDSPTVFADNARVTFALRLKDPGPAGSPAVPSPANAITVNRYHVKFVRSDGHNVEGVDVPYAFDGAFTLTVSDDASAVFTLVRVQAKREPPLAGIANGNGTRLSTIAQITFYGHDQTGREVIATANIGVNFGNWGDPE